MRSLLMSLSWTVGMDEMLFYGGIIGAGCILAAAVLYLCISRIQLSKLNAQLNEEYGKREKK